MKQRNILNLATNREVEEMKECKSCGKLIANNAETCPHCGYKVPMSTASTIALLIILIPLVLIIGFIVVSCGDAIFYHK